MTVQITKRRSQTFAVKVGITIVVIFILLGLLFKFSHLFITENKQDQKNATPITYYSIDNPIFIPVIQLVVSDPSLEKYWVESFRQKINGRSEVPIENGRVDIVTDNYAIEVDYFHKWQEGLGQALHYGDVLGKIPTLALIDDDNRAKAEHTDQLKYIEALCTKKGVKLLLLKNSNPN